MGSSWSKCSPVGWPTVRERMRQAKPARGNKKAAEGVGAASQDLDKHGALTSSNTPANNAECAWLEAQEEEEVGFPVRPQVPLRPMTYKAAVDLSFFLKEKGGLEGLIYSKRRQEHPDLLVYLTQTFFPDPEKYTSGPGLRYPNTLAWGYKFNIVGEEASKGGENDCLMHPMNLHGMEDEHKEILMWKFDSHLARRHMAREVYPEYYKDC
uniref:Protein Nef n=1 Tax=Human immunodeficiency virus type 1 TaxID=11676 RepID=A0A0C5K775_HV1|nr:nef protein [Human immunodeficiency virus 1]